MLCFRTRITFHIPNKNSTIQLNKQIRISCYSLASLYTWRLITHFFSFSLLMSAPLVFNSRKCASLASVSWRTSVGLEQGRRLLTGTQVFLEREGSMAEEVSVVHPILGEAFAWWKPWMVHRGVHILMLLQQRLLIYRGTPAHSAS